MLFIKYISFRYFINILNLFNKVDLHKDMKEVIEQENKKENFVFIGKRSVDTNAESEDDKSKS